MWSASSRTVISTPVEHAGTPLDAGRSAGPAWRRRCRRRARAPSIWRRTAHRRTRTVTRRPSDLGQRAQRVGDLLRELAGRDEHQPARAAGQPLADGEAGQHRQAEAERLAGAGLGPTEHVAAGEGVREGAGLDRERLFDAAPRAPSPARRKHRARQRCDVGGRLANASSSMRSSSEATDTLGARDWVDLLAPRFGRRAGAPVVREGAPARENPPAAREDPPEDRVGVDE